MKSENGQRRIRYTLKDSLCNDTPVANFDITNIQDNNMSILPLSATTRITMKKGSDAKSIKEKLSTARSLNSNNKNWSLEPFAFKEKQFKKLKQR